MATEARIIKVGLIDFVTKQKVETVTLNVNAGQKISEAGKEWMKKGYEGSVYVETHDHPKKAGMVIKTIFSTKSDFFLMFGCKKS